MKTEKQIQLCAREAGSKIYEKSRHLDIIRTTDKEISKWDVIEGYTYNTTPLLQEAILQIECLSQDKHDGTEIPVMNFVYRCEADDDNIKVCTDCFTHKNHESVWGFSMDMIVPKYLYMSDEAGTLIQITQITTPATMIYQKQKKSQSIIDDYLQCNSDVFKDVMLLFFKTMMHINYLMEHPQEKVVKKKSNGSSNNNKQSDKNRNSTSTIHHINLNNIIVHTHSTNVATKLRSKKIQRVASCWSVRGHYRHYKSGKVVYINSYEKGKDRNKDNNKEKKIYNI